MPLLFGGAYRAGAPWLALIAARLPLVLTAGLFQSALMACRREGQALVLTLWLMASTIIVLPAAAYWGGPRGVGWGMFGIELAAVLGGWELLRRLDVAPCWHHVGGRAVLACAGMGAVCEMLHGGSMALIVAGSAAAYGGAWWAIGRLTGISSLEEALPS